MCVCEKTRKVNSFGGKRVFNFRELDFLWPSILTVIKLKILVREFNIIRNFLFLEATNLEAKWSSTKEL